MAENEDYDRTKKQKELEEYLESILFKDRCNNAKKLFSEKCEYFCPMKRFGWVCPCNVKVNAKKECMQECPYLTGTLLCDSVHSLNKGRAL